VLTTVEKPLIERAVILPVVVLLGACPGSLPFPADGVRRVDLGGGVVDQWVPPTTDLSLVEGNPPTIDQRIVDQQPPDLTPPDQGIPTGGPCPCTAPTICVNNVCRLTCSAPTGGCKVTSSCPATHGCIPVTSAGYVCLPGAAVGSPCSQTVWCQNNHVCASVNGGAYSCLPLCTAAGAACGTGGQCLAANTCLFCSKP
jgi:hypothetical protein